MIDTGVVSDQNVEDMVDTAGYGIGYWVRSAVVDDEAQTYTLRLHEEENGKAVYVLTWDDLRKAYAALVDLDQRFVNREIHGYFLDSYRNRDADGIDGGYIDATAADVLVQVAAFGEVVFG